MDELSLKLVKQHDSKQKPVIETQVGPGTRGNRQAAVEDTDVRKGIEGVRKCEWRREAFVTWL